MSSSPMGYAEMRQLAETKLQYLCNINTENLVGPKSGQNLLAFFTGLCTNMVQLEQQLQHEHQQLKNERDTVAHKLQELESLKCDFNPSREVTAAHAAQSTQMNVLIDEMKQVSLSVADINPRHRGQVGAIEQLTHELQEHVTNQARHHAELAIQISELTNLAVDQKDKDRRKINRLRSMQADAEATIDNITDINQDLADRYESEKDRYWRTFDQLNSALQQLDDAHDKEERLRAELQRIRARSRDLSPRPRARDRSQEKRRSRS